MGTPPLVAALSSLTVAGVIFALRATCECSAGKTHRRREENVYNFVQAAAVPSSTETP